MYNLHHFKVKGKPLYIILQQVKRQELQFCHQKDQIRVSNSVCPDLLIHDMARELYSNEV